MERLRKAAALRLLLILKQRQMRAREHWVRPVWEKGLPRTTTLLTLQQATTIAVSYHRSIKTSRR